MISLMLAGNYSLVALSIDLELKKDHSLTIVIWAESQSAKIDLKKLQSVINDGFVNSSISSTIIKSPEYIEEGLKIRIRNILSFQDTLNFIDYQYSRSFFKEKYYFRLLLNSRIFQSEFFNILNHRKVLEDLLFRLAKDHFFLDIRLKAPGRCVFTNMTTVGDNYIFKTGYQDFRSLGEIIIFQSSRFIPSIYLTIFFLLFLLVFILFMYIIRRFQNRRS